MINTALIKEKYGVNSGEYFQYHHTFKTPEDLYIDKQDSFSFFVRTVAEQKDFTIAVVFNEEILPDQFVAEMILNKLHNTALMAGRKLRVDEKIMEQDWKVFLVFTTAEEAEKAMETITEALMEVGYRLKEVFN